MQHKKGDNVSLKKDINDGDTRESEKEICDVEKQESKRDISCKGTRDSDSDGTMNCDEKEPERQTKKPQENKTSPTRKRANTTHVPESDTTLSGKRKRLHSRGTPSSAYIPSNAAVSFIEDRSALPFPGASRRFYQRQNKTTSANMKRTRQREQQPVIRDEKKKHQNATEQSGRIFRRKY